MQDTCEHRWPKDMSSIKKNLDYLDIEVNRAVATYYVLKTMHREASRRPDIHKALNASKWAWAYILFSLQCTFFIQMERIFDGSSRHNVKKVVDMAIDHAQKNAPAKLPSLRRLEKRLDKYTKMVSSYRDIRRKVFAHPVFSKAADIDRLFNKTEVSEAETILRFLQRCVSALMMFILNGHDIRLRQQRISLKDKVVTDTCRLLRNIR